MAADKGITRALAEGIDPDAPQVQSVSFECRSCGERGPWVRTDVKYATGPIAWDAQHEEETGHSRYYRWSVTRNTVRVFRLPQRDD
ncbi:hypothetical protein ABGB09_34110 [Streptomyces sp. B8F3]|uniref:hypothetical protein n=1 Tax=Streptomyces sp. B8F3 TaxID=3153573 RepID=UPI00325E0C7C